MKDKKPSEELMELVFRLCKLELDFYKETHDYYVRQRILDEQADIKAKIQKIADSLDWISVEDRLPDNKEDCLVCDEYGQQFIAWWDYDEKLWVHQDYPHRFTHWKEKPKPPVKEK